MKATTKKTNKSANDTQAYRDGVLHTDGVSLSYVAARFGTPTYVYSQQSIVDAYQSYHSAFGNVAHLVCYAVKANPANAILATLAQLNAGFDIVSGGELAKVLQAGGDPQRVVFSGVGKMDDELDAALATDIRCFNVESASELRRLDRLARRRQCRAPVAFRVNPGIAAVTHPHIATGGSEHKFGIPHSQIAGLATEARAMDGIALQGLAMHIGSQMTNLAPLIEAATALRALADDLRGAGITLRHIDLGGGLGVGHQAPTIAEYVEALCQVYAGSDYELTIEPGRSLVAPAGMLLTRVLYIKHGDSKSFAIVDAGMNDLLRPALYGAHHEILNIETSDLPATGTYDIVGPVCESADTLGTNRRMALREGSILAVMDAGAYGSTMSSHYNSRPRCAEVIIEDSMARLSRQREAISELSRNEKFMTQETQ